MNFLSIPRQQVSTRCSRKCRPRQTISHVLAGYKKVPPRQLLVKLAVLKSVVLCSVTNCSPLIRQSLATELCNTRIQKSDSILPLSKSYLRSERPVFSILHINAKTSNRLPPPLPQQLHSRRGLSPLPMVSSSRHYKILTVPFVIILFEEEVESDVFWRSEVYQLLEILCILTRQFVVND